MAFAASLLPRHFTQPLFILVSKPSCTCLSALIPQIALQFSCFSLLLDKGDCSTDLFSWKWRKKELNNFRKKLLYMSKSFSSCTAFHSTKKISSYAQDDLCAFFNILIYYECIVYELCVCMHAPVCHSTHVKAKGEFL